MFSFDCEGKWGVADALGSGAHRSLTDDKLKTAYRRLLELMDYYGIPATFAFVGLFAEPAPEFAHLSDVLDSMARRSPDFLAPALADLRDGSRQGWHGAWAVDLVASQPIAHELAFHGVTHVPWDRMDNGLIEVEIGLFRALTSPIRYSRTMVFPRNRTGHLDAVRSLGIHGYRQGSKLSRAANYINEINPLPRVQFGGEILGGLVSIPAGYFVNWQHGLRQLIPREWSRQRAKLLMERAAVRSGSVVHFWLHPENIAQAPQTLGRIEDILSLARDARESGRAEVKTQLDFCIQVARQEVADNPGSAQTPRPFGRA
jgi:hypothetical protein